MSLLPSGINLRYCSSSSPGFGLFHGFLSCCFYCNWDSGLLIIIWQIIILRYITQRSSWCKSVWNYRWDAHLVQYTLSIMILRQTLITRSITENKKRHHSLLYQSLQQDYLKDGGEGSKKDHTWEKKVFLVQKKTQSIKLKTNSTGYRGREDFNGYWRANKIKAGQSKWKKTLFYWRWNQFCHRQLKSWLEQQKTTSFTGTLFSSGFFSCWSHAHASVTSWWGWQLFCFCFSTLFIFLMLTQRDIQLAQVDGLVITQETVFTHKKYPERESDSVKRCKDRQWKQDRMREKVLRENNAMNEREEECLYSTSITSDSQTFLHQREERFDDVPVHGREFITFWLYSFDGGETFWNSQYSFCDRYSSSLKSWFSWFHSCDDGIPFSVTDSDWNFG